MASEQSRLDRAVSILSERLDLNAEYFGTEELRAALLASLPVLLGAPVAWQKPSDADAVVSAEHVAWYAKSYPYRTTYGGWIALYAPSLGEGDGR